MHKILLTFAKQESIISTYAFESFVTAVLEEELTKFGRKKRKRGYLL